MDDFRFGIEKFGIDKKFRIRYRKKMVSYFGLCSDFGYFGLCLGFKTSRFQNYLMFLMVSDSVLKKFGLKHVSDSVLEKFGI